MSDPLAPRNTSDRNEEFYGGSAFADEVFEAPPAETPQPYHPVYAPVWTPRPRPRNRIWLHVLLLCLTVVTSTFLGWDHWLAFKADYVANAFSSVPAAQLLRQFWYMGFWYSATILTILGAHELGHYFACRYYGIDASLPYFIPAPPPIVTGTLGAVIRIRQPFPNRRVLFDVGIAGPIAGFVFAVPALFLGVALSHVARVPPDFQGYNLGEPLLFKLAAWSVWGSVPDGYSLNLHPMAFAAWFGLLATMLNLLPIGQLDGGHISYSVLRRRSTIVTLAGTGLVIALTFLSMSWLLWAILMVVMLFAFGLRHPPTLNDHEPLGRTRTMLVALAILMLALCFMPAPIDLIQ